MEEAYVKLHELGYAHSVESAGTRCGADGRPLRRLPSGACSSGVDVSVAAQRFEGGARDRGGACASSGARFIDAQVANPTLSLGADRVAAARCSRAPSPEELSAAPERPGELERTLLGLALSFDTLATFSLTAGAVQTV